MKTGSETVLPKPGRPERIVWAIVCAVAVVVWASLHLWLFSDRFVPLTYALPLFICVWSRDRHMLWGMAGFLALVATLDFLGFLSGQGPAVRVGWSVYLGQLADISVAAVVVHAIIALRCALEDRNTQLSILNDILAQANEEVTRQNEALEQSNIELEKANQELAAREAEISRQNEELTAQSEELARQNEELRAQGEELEQQAEELATLAEDLQHLNEELSRREELLSNLLSRASVYGQEDRFLETVCQKGLELLGDDVVAAAVIRSGDDKVEVESYVGPEPGTPGMSAWPADRSLAGVVFKENRTVSLADTRLRPDLVFPPPKETPVEAVLATPLCIGSQVRAVLEFYASRARPWTRDHFRLAEWLAAQASPVLEMLDLRRQLTSSEHRFRTTFERAAIGIAEIGLDGRFLQVNQRYCEITGYSLEEISERTWKDMTHPDDVEHELTLARRLAEGEIESYTLEKRHRRADGEFVWVNLTGSVLRDANSKPIRYIAAIEDITQRRQAAEALRESEQHVRRVLNTVRVRGRARRERRAARLQ